MWSAWRPCRRPAFCDLYSILCFLKCFHSSPPPLTVTLGKLLYLCELSIIFLTCKMRIIATPAFSKLFWESSVVMHVEVVCKAPCFTCGINHPSGVHTAMFSKAVGEGAGGGVAEMAKGRDGSGNPRTLPNYDASALHLYVYTRTCTCTYH